MPESMSARDRIRPVAESLREPRSVNWINEQADAAWSTTNEELQDLVDQSQLRRVEAAVDHALPAGLHATALRGDPHAHRGKHPRGAVEHLAYDN